MTIDWGRAGGAAVASATLLIAGAAFAQPQELCWECKPQGGHIGLQAGFLPDPQTRTVQAGGPLDVGALAVGEECYGNIDPRAPTLNMTFNGGPLQISAEPEDDSGGFTPADDLTLVILDPNGGWRCNDDAQDLNPVVSWADAPDGDYNIWVGNYAENERVAATISFTEFVDVTDDDGGATLPGGASEICITCAPLYETVSSGAQTQTVDVTAGGDFDASQLSGNCVGLITGEQPDITVQHGGGPLSVSVRSEGDTTLVMNDSLGNWLCFDDTDGLDPGYGWNNAPFGEYRVWVGTFAAADAAPATISVNTSSTPF